MTKGILFDNDGVLVNTEHLYYQTTKDVLHKAGIELSEADFVEYFLRQGRGAWHFLEKKNIPKEEIDKYREERNNNYYKLIYEQNTLLPGVKDTIKELAKNYKLGIVTSCRRAHFEAIHNNTELLDYFDFYLVREDYEKSKPDPEPYLCGLNKMGLSRDEVIIVEDSERGLKSANAADINCVVIPQGFTVGGNFEGSWKQVDNIKALKPLLH